MRCQLKVATYTLSARLQSPHPLKAGGGGKAGGSGKKMERRQFTPSSPPRKSWKGSGRGGRGARAGGGAPTNAAATRFPGTCLKGSRCRDASGSRREKPELARRRGGSRRRGAGECRIGGVTSTLRVPSGGDEDADR